MAWDNVETKYFEEKMMWLGVLRRAISDYVLYKGVRKHRLKWQMAHKFLFGDADYDGGLTFEEVCSVFLWEPSYIRRKIRELERCDIRKLESSKFRDDFKLDTAPPDIQTHSRFEGGGCTMPMFTKFGYSKSYREPVTLRATRGMMPVSAPMVQWQTAVA